MDVLLLTLMQLIAGFLFAGALFLVVAVCYSTLYHMRQDQIKDQKPETSWNDENKFFDTIEEFRSDFV